MRYLKLFESFNSNIFYHNSNRNDIIKFEKINNSNTKMSNYAFFSSEPNGFISFKGDNFEYKVSIDIDYNKIFNIYKDKNINGNIINSCFNKYENEIIDLLENNLDYFYKNWNDSNTDNPESVSEYYETYLSKLDLLIKFLTEWNDSWCILETDLFLNFIESKNYIGFLTIEEGIINLALNYKFNDNIKILDIEKIC